MRKKSKFIVLIFMLLPFLAYGETYVVEIGQFEKLRVNGNIELVYKNLPDSTGYAKYEAPFGSEDLFKFTVKSDGTLKAEPSDDKWGSEDLPVVYLYSDFLSSVESYSDRSVEILNLAPCASFNINQVGNGTITADNLRCNNITGAITTGNGSIYLSGVCVNANFRMVGTGLISADRLRAENVKCRILGTGSIGCWPIDNLSVTGLGSTKIYYKGSPNIKKKGGGKLYELPEEMDEDAYSRLGTPVSTLNIPVETYDYEEDEDYETVVTNDD